MKPLHMWLIFGVTCILDSVWMLVFMAPHGSLMETVQILVAMPYMPLSFIAICLWQGRWDEQHRVKETADYDAPMAYLLN